MTLLVLFHCFFAVTLCGGGACIYRIVDDFLSTRESVSVANFSFAPAPVIQKKTSAPIDLGQFDETYAGWLVVIDLDTTLEANELIAVVSDETVSMKDRNAAMMTWLSLMLVAWNFVDDQGNPLPQPRDGGVKFCKQDLIQPISQAIAQAVTPKKS